MNVHESTNHEPGTKRIEEKPTNLPSVIGGFHTWAFEWTPDEMKFFFDGQIVWNPTLAENPWLATAFSSRGVNFRVNTQVGESWMGFTDPDKPWETRLPASFDIDYIRVWKLPQAAKASESFGVALRAGVNSKFVTAEAAGSLPLIANRPMRGPWENFDIVPTGNGEVALRARANGNFVCADGGGLFPLVANRQAIGPWERFQLLYNTDGTVSLKSLANGKFVTAESAGESPLIANRERIAEWEKFDMVSN